MTYKNIKYKKSPLPFAGQKRGMLKHFCEALAPYVHEQSPVVDMFGGSGLLANACLELGFRDVTYNDYDNFVGRLSRIEQTNQVLRGIRGEIRDYRKEARMSDEDRTRVISLLEYFARTYDLDYWNLEKYIALTSELQDKRFVYFTSSKSQVVGLYNALEDTGHCLMSPFTGAQLTEKTQRISVTGGYTDQMYVKL